MIDIFSYQYTQLASVYKHASYLDNTNELQDGVKFSQKALRDSDILVECEQTAAPTPGTNWSLELLVSMTSLLWILLKP